MLTVMERLMDMMDVMEMMVVMDVMIHEKKV